MTDFVMNLLAPQAWAVWVGQALLAGTLLALLTGALLRWPLARLHPGLHAALWIVVLLKFVAPTGPALPLSAAWMLAQAADQLAPDSQTTPLTTRAPVVRLELRDAASETSLQPAPHAAGAAAWRPDWVALLGWLYLSGLALVVLRHIARHRSLTRQCRALPAAPCAVQALVAELCHERGVRIRPTVRVGDIAPAPFVFGLIRPTLVLPLGRFENRDALQAVILHELAHIRRGDMLVRCLQLSVGTLLYFWPVVGWVNRQIDLVRELACDEWALRHGRLSPADYARCLLHAVQRSAPTPRGLAPAAMAANLHTVERRIDMILNHSASRLGTRLSLLSAVGVLGWSSFVLAGAGPVDEPQDTAKETPTVFEVRVLQHNDEPAQVDVTVEPGGVWQAAGAGATTFVAHRSAFKADIPGADVNGDGNVELDEFHAFVSAKAMLDPAAVIAEYPQADANADGLLDASEAVQLITAGIGFPGKPGMRVFSNFAGGGAPKVVDEDITISSDDAGKKIVRIVRRDENGESTSEEVLAGKIDVATPGKVIVTRMGDGAAAKLPAGLWINENIMAAPAAQDVAKMLPLVTAAATSSYLKKFPEADANADGALTAEEMGAHKSASEQQALAKLLAKFPEADANADGVLTSDELKQHFVSKQGGVWMEASPDR